MTLGLEQRQVVIGFGPVDLQTAANSGDWVSLKNYKHVEIHFVSAVGTAGDDPTLTLGQATAVAGTGDKALAVIDTVYRKQAATDLTGTGQWTKATQTAAATYTDTDSAEEFAHWVVHVDADELDVDNDFDCIRATVADVGSNAQLGVLWYELSEPRFPAAPENMLSAIVD